MKVGAITDRGHCAGGAIVSDDMATESVDVFLIQRLQYSE